MSWVASVTALMPVIIGALPPAVVPPRPDRLRVRLRRPLPGAEIAAHHLLPQEVLGHFQVHLAVEPGDEAADLGTVDRVYADQQFLAVGFVEIFDNRLS